MIVTGKEIVAADGMALANQNAQAEAGVSEADLMGQR